jgi:hypothetical protein
MPLRRLARDGQIIQEAGSRIKQAPRLDSNKGVVEYTHSDAIAFWVPQRRGQQGAAFIFFVAKHRQSEQQLSK